MLLLVAVLSSTLLYSQKSVNNYAYVIVPTKFEFLKTADEYQLNSLSKFLFEKYGFTVYMDNEVPEELLQNPCNGLKADVIDHSGLFTSKLVVTLTDCMGTIVFESKEGKSKDKKYKVAYNEAVREAFEDVEALSYVYDGSAAEVATVPVVETAPEVKTTAVVAVVPEEKTAPNKELVNSEANSWIAKTKDGLNYTVYNNGNTIVMELLYTAIPDVYLIKGKDALLYKNDKGIWLISENDGAQMKTTGVMYLTFQ
ncbi:hypothetical protein Y10_11860 [Neptunitalea sp. Y10]|uniref:Uncharacterized protein n=2 Tax=Neptunitalea lumnitzerae TaxID=2965509 RepID=A0ABQ5MHC7_9FLAO|nr:hypothetical protein Y10_11860 [Neptunitalea sp. Y10]